MLESHLKNLPLLFRGKVRDVYDLGQELLIVTTDRLSAFDVILSDPIPQKGRVLTQITQFWLNKFATLIKTQVSSTPLASALQNEPDFSDLMTRSMIVKKAQPLPIECIVRGYLVGSGYKDYQKTGQLCGITLPVHLQQASPLPEPLFTPSTKAEQGAHDENISFAAMINQIGKDLAIKVRDVSLELYQAGARHAKDRGIIIADTKFEFGLIDDELVLIDEVLTPDSSRFWPEAGYVVGISPPSFDKQFVRDYLETLDWNKTAPAPKLPAEIIQKTSEKYQEALRILTQ